jgi:hypothetical protein
MKLSSEQIEPEPLAALATEASCLLRAGNFSELAAQFGYAVALGRDTLTAIQEDLTACLARLREVKLNPTAQPTVQVKYFKPNNTQLHAVAECRLASASGGGILLEFVIFGAGNDFHATLEQISAAA